jgi:hypothetical protein
MCGVLLGWMMEFLQDEGRKVDRIINHKFRNPQSGAYMYPKNCSKSKSSGKLKE